VRVLGGAGEVFDEPPGHGGRGHGLAGGDDPDGGEEAIPRSPLPCPTGAPVDGPHLGQGRSAGVDDVGQRVGRALGVASQRGRGALGLHHHDRDSVRDHVVEFAGEVGSFRRDGEFGALALFAFQVGGAPLQRGQVLPAGAGVVAA